MIKQFDKITALGYHVERKLPYIIFKVTQCVLCCSANGMIVDLVGP